MSKKFNFKWTPWPCTYPSRVEVLGLIGMDADGVFCGCDVPGCRVYFAIRVGATGSVYVWDGEGEEQWKVDSQIAYLIGFRPWGHFKVPGFVRDEFRRAIRRYTEGCDE
jgi:hypothetical protein